MIVDVRMVAVTFLPNGCISLGGQAPPVASSCWGPEAINVNMWGRGKEGSTTPCCCLIRCSQGSWRPWLLMALTKEPRPKKDRGKLLEQGGLALNKRCQTGAH